MHFNMPVAIKYTNLIQWTDADFTLSVYLLGFCFVTPTTPLPCLVVQYSTLQYSAVEYSTVQYSRVQYSAVQYSAMQCSKVQ